MTENTNTPPTFRQAINTLIDTAQFFLSHEEADPDACSYEFDPGERQQIAAAIECLRNNASQQEAA